VSSKEKDEIEAKLSLIDRYKDYMPPMSGQYSTFRAGKSAGTDAHVPSTQVTVESVDEMVG